MQTIGGYRLVRRLATGRHSDVWLGHRATGEEKEIVAVKTFRSSANPERIDAEIEALARLTHPHVQRLEDIASDERGQPALILRRLAGESVGRILEQRHTLSAGEAVTLLAPLADAVADMHRVGVAHQSLSPTAVRLDERGSPVITGFSTAALFAELPDPPDGVAAPPAVLAASADAARDTDALRRLASLVLSRVHGSPLDEWLREPASAETFPHELGDRIFRLAEPLPLAHAQSGGGADDIPGRVESGGVPIRATAATAAADVEGPAEGWLAAIQLPPWLDRVAGDALHRAGSALAGVRAHWQSVRRPYRVAGAVGAAALLVSVAVLSITDSDAGALIDGTHADGASDTESLISSASDGAEIVLAETAPPVSPRSEEPTEAARELLEHRARCIAELSAACLTNVNQRDSPAMDADRSLIASIRGGAELPEHIVADEVKVTDAFGDVVLLEVASPGSETPPASLLMVRGETGWLIRNLSG